MNSVIVIPARIGSTRFPRKPLTPIAGRLLIERTFRIAKAVRNNQRVIIATDSDEVRSAAESFGAEVVLTQQECENGTLRTWLVAQNLDPVPNCIINLQGDAVLTPPSVIEAVIESLTNHPDIQIATPATALSWAQYDQFIASKEAGKASGTLVVFDRFLNALYFSKGIIPFVRNRGENPPPIFRHIGLYGYRLKTLNQYSSLSPSPLEQMEGLEQLRALENGIPIRIVPVDYSGRTHWSIDNLSDVVFAEEIIKREGELVP